jgi:hypothetical protein
MFVYWCYRGHIVRVDCKGTGNFSTNKDQEDGKDGGSQSLEPD